MTLATIAVLKSRKGLTRLRQALLFIGVCCLSPLAFSQVGNQFSTADSIASPSTQLALHASDQRVNELERAVELLETDQGAWGAGLSEQLTDLADVYQLRGDHDLAIDAYERALHVNRVNYGLYDMSQVDIVDNMIESLVVTRQWEDVHDKQEYLYWLHVRNYGELDPRMLPVIDQIGSWYINDYALNPGNRVVNHVVDAYQLFSKATRIVETQYGRNDLRMVVPLRGLVLSNWFLWTFASQNPGSLASYDNFNSQFSTSRSFTDNPNRLAPYVRNNYSNGKKALDRIIEIYEENPESPPGAAATAKIELADWHMLSRRWRSATELYEEAYKSLSEDEATREHATKMFERPVALPDLELMESDVEQFSQRRINSNAGPSSYVMVSYDVSRFGEARNIDILESHPKNDVAMRTRVKRSLANTRFRPRLVDGEAVESKGLVQKYLFN